MDVFLLSYVGTYTISSILPLGPQNLKYLLSGPLYKFASPWPRAISGIQEAIPKSQKEKFSNSEK